VLPFHDDGEYVNSRLLKLVSLFDCFLDWCITNYPLNLYWCKKLFKNLTLILGFLKLNVVVYLTHYSLSLLYMPSCRILLICDNIC